MSAPKWAVLLGGCVLLGIVCGMLRLPFYVGGIVGGIYGLTTYLVWR